MGVQGICKSPNGDYLLMITYGKAVAPQENPVGHDSENDKFWREVKSKDSRVGVAPRTKQYKSQHTIAPAYNKGPVMVITESCIKDIGK